MTDDEKESGDLALRLDPEVHRVASEYVLDLAHSVEHVTVNNLKSLTFMIMSEAMSAVEGGEKDLRLALDCVKTIALLDRGNAPSGNAQDTITAAMRRAKRRED